MFFNMQSKFNFNLTSRMFTTVRDAKTVIKSKWQ